MGYDCNMCQCLNSNIGISSKKFPCQHVRICLCPSYTITCIMYVPGNPNPTFLIGSELTSKHTANFFYNGEVEEDIRLYGLVHEYKYFSDADRERHMEKLSEIRQYMIYPHTDCSASCRGRGTK